MNGMKKELFHFMILISKYQLFQALQVNAVSEYFHYLFTTLVSYLIHLFRNFLKTDVCQIQMLN